MYVFAVYASGASQLLVGVAFWDGRPYAATSVTKCEKDWKVYVERVPESEQGFEHLTERKNIVVVSSGGAPTPAGTSVFTKHNWDMGLGYLWLNGWGIYHLMGGAFMA